MIKKEISYTSMKSLKNLKPCESWDSERQLWSSTKEEYDRICRSITYVAAAVRANAPAEELI